MLIIYYRYTPIKNEAPRPKWFSKKLCLKSFLLSCDDFLRKNPKKLKINFAIDQKNKLTNRELKLFKKIMLKYNGEIILLNLNSGVASYLKILDDLFFKKGSSVILFAEDDYLWRKNALAEMYLAIKELPVDYITPYDHPVRYDNNFNISVDLVHYENKIFRTNSSHFRTQESTCMTFMVKKGIIKEDRGIHLKFCDKEKKCPNDRELFRCLQKLGKYRNRKGKRRLLVGPIPSLATHLHLPFLAPVVDWREEVKIIKNEKHIIKC